MDRGSDRERSKERVSERGGGQRERKYREKERERKRERERLVLCTLILFYLLQKLFWGHACVLKKKQYVHICSVQVCAT